MKYRPKLETLSNSELLKLYGRLKLNITLAELFNPTKPPLDVYQLLKNVNYEISFRKLDQQPHEPA